ncbi:hypothetical protein [Acidicapsa ligni]|uniref:hypothetical protein n=1 Tax=Acidicapsa ligni TaxID=542300 RepID=UPI0021E0D9D1|nr:hypothetical protein [Acidicapsa ligni]
MVQFGDTIQVNKDASIRDAVCFFCGVNVQGTINGDTVVFFGSARIDGQANHDVVVFFGNVVAADNTSIGHNLVNFFGSVRLGENVTVGQDTVVMFGSLHAPQSVSYGGDRVVQPGFIFWVPFLLIVFGFSFVVRELRGQRRRRMLRGY